MKIIIWLVPLLILNIVAKCDSKIKDNIFQNLRKKTKFLVTNEPIVDLDFSENLFHSLLFDLEIDNNNIYTLDEDLLNLQKLNHSSIFKLLINTYEQVSKENENIGEENKIKYIILASSHTRIHPINLEYLLLKFDKYIYNGNIYQNGDIDIKGILHEYNNEIKESLEKKKKFKNISDIIDEKYKDDIVLSLLNKEIGSSDKFIKKVSNSNDSNNNYNNQYKGMFVGYGFNDDEPSILHDLNENKNFLFPSTNSGIILDIILLKNIYENYINIQKKNEKIIHKDYIYEISQFIYNNINVELVHFENTCLDAKQNVYLTNKENTEFDVYKYYLTKGLFENYESTKDNEEKNYESIILSYFQLAYPITTCATYSGRSQNETFIGFDKFNMISIENDEKLKYYIKETEEISFTNIEEYKKKFNDINKRYDEILDNGENNLTHKDIVFGIKTSINTEDRINYIKNTFDNKQNNKHIFSNFKITPLLKNQKETSIINTELLKGGFDNEDIDIQIFYMSDNESKLYNTVKYDTDGVSKNNSCEKLKHVIFHFYEEYVEKDKNKNNNKNLKKQKYLFIGNDDTFVNIKNLVDVMNVSSNKCMHIKKHMYDKYLKSFRFLKKNEHKFFKNFNENPPLFYQYIKQNFIDTIRNLKKYNYIPKYCKDNNNNNGIKSYPKFDVPIFLGKRQSYNTFYNDNESYDYLSSEAGILINDSFAKKIYFCKNCVCHNNEQSDDMMLGEWANKLNILTIDFEGFFQNNPANYNKKYLNTLVPITYNNLNLNKTVDEIKKTYFQYLVNYNKDEIDDKTDSCIDYLDHNFKNTFDNIFHYFFYLKRYYNSSNDEKNNDISKINKKIFAKMEYSGSYKKLFNLSHFFKEEIENMIQFKHNIKNGTKKGKVNYANNYVVENNEMKTNENYENEELDQDDYNDDTEEDDEDDLFSEDDFDYDRFIKDIENIKKLYKEQAQQHEKKENSTSNKHDAPKSDDTPDEDYNTEL
ncbi:parasite-infected erythrocyte surface protein [Plasmodium vinckei brucechwatti]|uniref:Parasite-infected erythrocyte surface protein n=1 Tax=Plasmodium vinckei brucechwatti TaxID=119398 RepID=A0A6V7RXP9_PLAVN|nr:parasite-infected erythrocyte surface protein [Plasmodium vinckei brucechwatti]